MSKYTELTDSQARAMNFIFAEYSENAWYNLMQSESTIDEDTTLWEPFEDYPLDNVADMVIQLDSEFRKSHSEGLTLGYEIGFNDYELKSGVISKLKDLLDEISNDYDESDPKALTDGECLDVVIDTLSEILNTGEDGIPLGSVTPKGKNH